MKRRKRFLAILVVVLAAGIFLLANTGSALVVDQPRQSDVIVVLAGETDRRPALAEVLLEKGMAQHVVLDVPANAMLYNVSELEIAKKYAESLPRGRDWSLCPIAGLSTRDEVKEALACAEQVGSNRPSILVVTSDFHTRRALSVVRQQAQGRQVSVAAAYDPAEFGVRWWTHRQWAKVCFDEWLRLAWWETVDRWR